MLYQLAIYALSQAEGASTTMLYPTLEPEASEARIEVRDPVRGQARAYVVLRPINLLVLARLISGPSTAQAQRQRIAFARWLMFGGPIDDAAWI